MHATTRLRVITLATIAAIGIAVPAALSAATPSDPDSAGIAVFRPIVLTAAPVTEADADAPDSLPESAFSVPSADLLDAPVGLAREADAPRPARVAPKVEAAAAFKPKPTPKPKPKPTAKAHGSTAVSYGSSHASGARARIVAIALAQRGDRYVSGGVGPSSFDCSGLVRYAYNQAGVGGRLGGGHSASAMLAWGRSHGLTSRTGGRPGDVAIYGNGSHAAIYIGNGKIVSALNPSQGIRVTGLNALGASFTTFIHTRI